MPPHYRYESSEINFISSLLRRLLPLLVVYLIVTGCAAAQFEVTRNVGENLIFPCTKDTHRQLRLLYWQKKGVSETYVNGFHLTKRINQTPWENTTVDPKAGAVHMNYLNVSHEGNYTCHIQFNDSTEVESIEVELHVTAPYSNISHSEQCDKENHECRVTCWGHGGHPSAPMELNLTWNNSEHQLTVINSNEERDPNTLLVNSSSTAMINCTGEELKFFCSVGGTTSEVISVCGGQQSSFDFKVGATILAAILIFVILAGVCIIWKRKHGKSKTMPESGEDPEVATALTHTPAAS